MKRSVKGTIIHSGKGSEKSQILHQTHTQRVHSIGSIDINNTQEIEETFWKTHGGRPRGKGEIPRYLFDEVNAEFLRKWQELKDEYTNSEESISIVLILT